MGTAYWAGGTSTDTNTAANWVDTANGTHASNPFQRGGVDAVPNNADDVIIQSTSNSNVDRNPTQNAAHTFNSLVLESGSQWTADGTNHLTLDGEDANDFAIRIINGTFVHSNGTVVINNGGGGIAHAAIEAGDATSTNGIYDLTITGGGTTCEIYGDTTIRRNMESGGAETLLRGALTVTGTLNVSAGTLNTRYSSTDRNLTVTGNTIVGDGSSGANAAKLTCNASTISLGASYTADYALRVKRGGTFEGGSGQHTFGSFSNEDHADSITTLTTHANGTTLSSEYSSAGPNGYALAVYDDSTFDDADGLVVYTGPSADSYLSGKTLHNVTINSSGNTIGMQNAHTFNGNLTITAGTLNTRPASTTENNALTVTGATDVTGTLTLNDSAVLLGALRANSGAAITQGSSGTLELTSNTAGLDAGFGDRYAFKNDDATSDINLAGTMTISNANYSLFGTAPSGASVVQNLVINTGHYWINTLTLGGTLVVNASKHLQTYGSATGGSRAIKVTGDVTINGHLTTYKAAELDLAAEFGSLTINSGGTYTATSGTTTITSKNGSGYGIQGGGTFTHNNGEVKVTGNAYRFPVGATYYDFTWDTSSEPCYLYSTALSGGATIDGTQNASYTAILGTLKINDRGFLPYNASKVFINNLIIGDNTDSANATNFNFADNDVFDGIVIVNNVLINADGQLKFGDGDETSATEGSSALEIRGAFRNLGGANGVTIT